MIRILFLSLVTPLLLSANYSQALKNVDLDDAEKLLLGAKIYNETCVSCHGKSGETDEDMQLIIKPRVLKKTILTAEQSYEIIKHGAHHFGAHADIMPSFKYVYNDEKILSLAFYIHKTFNPKGEEKREKLLKASKKLSNTQNREMMQVGEKLFANECAKCHGKLGNKESEYVQKLREEENFIFPYDLRRTLLSQDQIFLYAKYGGHFWGADKEDMPAWKSKYSDVALKSVAKYITQRVKKLK